MSRISAGDGAGVRASDHGGDLEDLYFEYRRREARKLIRLLPGDAIRPLYRRAHRAAQRAGSVDDPMELLAAYCEALLPLPTFEIWLQDALESPEAHLREMENALGGSVAATLVGQPARRLYHRGTLWSAQLCVFPDDDVWRGYIAFQDLAGRGRHRTAVVFREVDRETLGQRFSSFDEASLAAFLRSALP